MGRPPCCDKVGIKKGPWTPEEDIVLVSYIQEHGPGNWRSVPTNTGLLRCSKSCRLRWTNYLRPGIKRGNFTPHEEGMIIHLQALLGNKWAAIASYLPQRTDNDIKNYWNTHLKKKLKKFQSSGFEPQSSSDSTTYKFMPKNCAPASSGAVKLNENNSPVYASSAENISRLLEGWMRTSPKNPHHHHNMINRDQDNNITECSVSPTSVQGYRPQVIQDEQEGNNNINNVIHGDEFESILSFENLDVINCGKSSFSDSSEKGSENGLVDEVKGEKPKDENNNYDDNNNPPLSFLEKWLLLDESTTAAQVGEVMELQSMF